MGKLLPQCLEFSLWDISKGKGWSSGGWQHCTGEGGAVEDTLPSVAESNRSVVSSHREGRMPCTDGPLSTCGGGAQGHGSVSTTWVNSILGHCQVGWPLGHTLLSRCHSASAVSNTYLSGCWESPEEARGSGKASWERSPPWTDRWSRAVGTACVKALSLAGTARCGGLRECKCPATAWMRRDVSLDVTLRPDDLCGSWLVGGG